MCMQNERADLSSGREGSSNKKRYLLTPLMSGILSFFLPEEEERKAVLWAPLARIMNSA